MRLKKRLLTALGKREMSVRTARARLAAWGADEACAAGIIAGLVAGGVLDDARAAEAFCRATLARRKVSAAWLRGALEKHGIEPELAHRAAQEAAAKQPKGLSIEARRRRVLGVLARRGFEEDAALAAVEAALEGEACD
ncbi:MAG: RecX family transcriptional regulator [Planctomycetota bacterium]|nr:RecX family transcriptional regulator [Planctomycetota bacterium]